MSSTKFRVSVRNLHLITLSVNFQNSELNEQKLNPIIIGYPNDTPILLYYMHLHEVFYLHNIFRIIYNISPFFNAPCSLLDEATTSLRLRFTCKPSKLILRLSPRVGVPNTKSSRPPPGFVEVRIVGGVH